MPISPVAPAFPLSGNNDDNNNNCLLDFSGDDDNDDCLLDFGGDNDNNGNSMVSLAGYIYYNAYCIDY